MFVASSLARLWWSITCVTVAIVSSALETLRTFVQPIKAQEVLSGSLEVSARKWYYHLVTFVYFDTENQIHVEMVV